MNIMVALLIAGSAILLISCSSEGGNGDDYSPPEDMITQQADTLVRIESENGVKRYRFYAPLVENYGYAKEPYTEYRRGVNITTYDSLGAVSSTLVADYAINFTKRQLWEAKGNVYATGSDGRSLETQQLFWNQITGRIYSNVDSRIMQNGEVLLVEGFESDQEFDKWEFRNAVGTMTVSMGSGTEPEETDVEADAESTESEDPSASDTSE